MKNVLRPKSHICERDGKKNGSITRNTIEIFPQVMFVVNRFYEASWSWLAAIDAKYQITITTHMETLFPGVNKGLKTLAS